MSVLAVDIGGTAVKTGLVDKTGEVKRIRAAAYDLPVTKEGVLQALFRAAGSYSKEDYEGIAVSTTGQVEDDGSIGYASDNIPGYAGTPLREWLENTFGKRAVVVRDSLAMAWGEIAYGAGKDYTDFLCVTFGSGIGGALVINGQPYQGSNRGAGHVGHITIRKDGEVCQCGKKGCFEAYASAKALTERMEKACCRRFNGKEIIQMAQEAGHGLKDTESAAENTKQLAGKILHEWIGDVCTGLASLIHVLNPACLVLGGGIMESDVVIEIIRRELYNYVIDASGHFEIRQAVSGNAVNLAGAAYVYYK